MFSKISCRRWRHVLQGLMIFAVILSAGWWAPRLSWAGDQMPGMSSSTENNMMAAPKITDAELQSWIGRWNGTQKMNDQSCTTELTWKLILQGEWLEGDLRAWSDKEKKNLVQDMRLYIRPGDEAGTYKIFGIDNYGSGQTGQATVQNGTWTWNWTYDNGGKELGTLTYPAKGEVQYKSTISDKMGKTVGNIDLNLTKEGTTHALK